MPEGADAIRFIDGIAKAIEKIMTEDREEIEKASSIIADALLKGRSVYCMSEGHIPPLANAYGTLGNPNFFTPYEVLVGHFTYFPTVSMKGDVVVLLGQFDSSPFTNEIAAKAKVLGAYTIFVGTRADRRIIPLTMPLHSLPEVCDLTIDLFGTPMEGLISFDGLDIEACPTGGITDILMFHVLNLEVAEKISKEMERSGTPKSPESEPPLFFRGLAQKR
jgi:uncharacterized phosphosugar-binding protein